MKVKIFLIASLAFAMAAWAQPTYAQFAVTWAVAPENSPANWNVDANWLINNQPATVPDAVFGDTAVIANGGTAQINGGVPSVVGLEVTNGTAEILQGGSLNVFETATIGGNGNLLLSGNASLLVGTDFVNSGAIRISGSNATLDVDGNLTNSGRLVAEITSANHTTINVGGQANVGGIVQVEFNGFSPGVNDSWTLIDAGSLVDFGPSAEVSGAGSLARGLSVELRTDVNNGQLLVETTNKLILSVDRFTGESTISNVIGDSIEFIGYAIGGPSVLNPGGWNSLTDQGQGTWEEANPTSNLLTELNPTGSSTLNVGQSIELGNAYSFSPSGIGVAPPPVTFQYGTEDGRLVEGIVEMMGRHNDLVLTVDPTTGEAAIQNQSGFQAEILGYSISSPSGSLRPDNANWISLQDAGVAGFEEANPTESLLTELNPTDSTIWRGNEGQLIGSPWNPSGERDLVFEIVLGDTVHQGLVVYGAIPDMTPDPAGLAADFNMDGTVNLTDFNILKGNFGGSNATKATGDADGDGTVNLTDFNILKGQFGQSAASVPEPAALILFAMGLVCLVVRRVWHAFA